MCIIEQVPAYLVWPVRHQVMYPEKEFDSIKLPEDELGMHLALFDQNKLISVISVFQENNVFQFRKFATLIEFQGQGYGSKLLQYVIDDIRKNNGAMIWCNARKEAIDFYKKFGFMETKETFERGGYHYTIMKLVLETI